MYIFGDDSMQSSGVFDGCLILFVGLGHEKYTCRNERRMFQYKSIAVSETCESRQLTA